MGDGIFWPGWVGGMGLATVALGHWLWTRRLMAVSGRYSAVVNRLREGPDEMARASADELIAALRDATLEEFGEEALGALPELSDDGAEVPYRRGMLAHLLFFAGLTGGGAIGTFWLGGWSPEFAMRGEMFTQIFGGADWVAPVVLTLGGVAVGAGTRMAAGCTSGHGLCGVSRMQPGSLAATMAFFGTGIAVSMAFGSLM